jgi:hypothetical protein
MQFSGLNDLLPNEQNFDLDKNFWKKVSISCAKYKMTEKRQTSQGYIIRILQHLATKLRNISNFVILFQAVMKFLSRSKFCSLGNRSINLPSNNW